MAIQTPKIAKPDNSGESTGKVVTNMLFFWLVAGIMIAKDLIDLLLTAIEAVTAATVVAIPISVLCAILGAIMTFTVAIIAVIYHIYTRRGIVTKIMITSICALIGMIPVINLLPDATIAFFASFFAGSIMKVAGKVVSKVASGAGSLATPSS